MIVTSLPRSLLRDNGESGEKVIAQRHSRLEGQVPGEKVCHCFR
jgi:hypothetical protein